MLACQLIRRSPTNLNRSEILKFTKRATEILGSVATKHDIMDMLNEFIEKAGSQRKASVSLGISSAFLHDVLHGKSELGDKIPAALGYKKVTVYVKEEK